VPLSTVAGLRRAIPQLRLYDAYGLPENPLPATILLDAEFERKPGSIGRPVPCCDVRIVDPDGSDLPTGEAGELLVRGPNITSGYVGDPAATAIRDGWLHTGDYCRVDAEGFVYLLDRIKDVVIRGGYKVYSVELEYLSTRVAPPNRAGGGLRRTRQDRLRGGRLLHHGHCRRNCDRGRGADFRARADGRLRRTTARADSGRDPPQQDGEDREGPASEVCSPPSCRLSSSRWTADAPSFGRRAKPPSPSPQSIRG